MCRWFIEGDNGEYAVEVEATCAQPGTRLRAPTLDSGLTPFCTDSFSGELTVRIWQKGPAGGRLPDSLIELKSSAGGDASDLACRVTMAARVARCSY